MDDEDQEWQRELSEWEQWEAEQENSDDDE